MWYWNMGYLNPEFEIILSHFGMLYDVIWCDMWNIPPLSSWVYKQLSISRWGIPNSSLISRKIPNENGWFSWWYPYDETETSIWVSHLPFTHDIYLYIYIYLYPYGERLGYPSILENLQIQILTPCNSCLFRDMGTPTPASEQFERLAGQWLCHFFIFVLCFWSFGV